MSAKAPGDAAARERRTFVTRLVCSMTGEAYEADRPHNLSKAGRPLLVEYDLEAMRSELDRDALTATPQRGADAGFWRYRQLLPVRRDENEVSLGEVMAPVFELPSRSEAPARGRLWIKDEGRLPTGSFKARGLCLAVAMAKEFGIGSLSMPTNGNAGAALAAYARRAGMRATVLCPHGTPEVNVSEIEARGATVYRVEALIDECGALLGGAAATTGSFDVSTLKEPYRIEGKKTMGLELAEQLGWTLPDVILYPTGGGTGLIGMWKAFRELEALGWIGSERPRMVAVQAAGCAPIVRAYERGERHAERWEDAHTVAAGIRVPAAVGDFLIPDAVRESKGFAIAVDDDAIVAARDSVADRDGVLLCPEGAATIAAYDAARADGRISESEHCVAFNCATGLKYPLPPVTRTLDIEATRREHRLVTR